MAEAVERAWKEEVPARGNPSGGRPKGGNRRDTTVKHRDEADGILARLKRDDDALAQQVINGEATECSACTLPQHVPIALPRPPTRPHHPDRDDHASSPSTRERP